MTARFENLKSYPAYDVVKLASSKKVYDGEVLTDKKHLENWKLGSVVGYALENGKDPIAAYNRAVENKHATHYAMALGAVLTDTPRKQQARIEVSYGDIIEFHGQEFRIDKAPNHNINLIKVS